MSLQIWGAIFGCVIVLIACPTVLYFSWRTRNVGFLLLLAAVLVQSSDLEWVTAHVLLSQYKEVLTSTSESALKYGDLFFAVSMFLAMLKYCIFSLGAWLVFRAVRQTANGSP